MQNIRRMIQEFQPIVGAAIGAGMSATAAEMGNADLLMVLNAGYFRSHGCSSMASLMPYSNANNLTWDIATKYIMPRVKHTPIFLGIFAHDPYLNLDSYLHEIKGQGILGVTNFPSVGFVDGKYREALEETGLGYEYEIEMLAQAKKYDLMTIGFCFNSDEAIKMALAGVDILCLDLGWAEWRETDFEEHKAALNHAVDYIKNVITSVKKITPKPYFVILGGPVILPKDTIQIYRETEILGYIGGSTIERFPAASNITQTVQEFKQATISSKHINQLGSMVGVSFAMQQVFHMINCVAQSDVPVLIVGESGTGKELVAREIHRLSSRKKKPFICWNCGAITESLCESELFGHEKGSFTGAVGRKLGKFEIADGGTLFMDEISNLQMKVQSALLRAIQEKEIIRVGGEENIQIDVRLIAASNRDFTELIQSGEFRLDLYYRLNTFVLRIPPLRERKEDIPFLVTEFIQEFSEKYNYPIPRIPKQAMDVLVNHIWPGNIRELRNAIERCFILGQGKRFSIEWLDEMFNLDKNLEKEPVLKVSKSDQSAKRDRLFDILSRYNGNKTIAAKELGVSRKTIYNWLNTQPYKSPPS
ncbi:AAA family ATPase [Candidatus Poribacteria bacterium]|nr:AAA family ATPase [Candidatus Poribacteria bacterium]